MSSATRRRDISEVLEVTLQGTQRAGSSQFRRRISPQSTRRFTKERLTTYWDLKKKKRDDGLSFPSWNFVSVAVDAYRCSPFQPTPRPLEAGLLYNSRHSHVE